MITKEVLKELIARIKKATGKTQREISEGAGYRPDSLSELVSQKNASYEPAYNQLSLIYAAILKSSMPDALAQKDPGINDRFTADQLFHMYMKAMERQDSLMQTQLAILRSIEEKMARESTLAKMEPNLTETLAGVLSLSKRQKQAISDVRKDLAELKSRKSRQVPGSSKKLRETDGEGKKRGIRP